MKKNLLSIIILALLVVNIVLSAIMMISVGSATKKTADLVADISTIIGLEIDGLQIAEEENTTVSPADVAVYNITDELTIPLQDDEDGTKHYAVGRVSLSMNTVHADYAIYGETLEAREGLITEIIFSVMAQHSMDEARTNPDLIKSEILASIQELFDSDFIYAVSFSFLYS